MLVNVLNIGQIFYARFASSGKLPGLVNACANRKTMSNTTGARKRIRRPVTGTQRPVNIKSPVEKKKVVQLNGAYSSLRYL